MAETSEDVLFVNPLQQTERETNSGGASRVMLRLSVLITVCAVVFSWFFIRPPAGIDSGINGFWIMILWLAIVIMGAAALLFFGRASYRGIKIEKSAAVLGGAAAAIAILGTVTAFLSGDKFDAVRAAMVSIILIIMGYSRRRYRGKTVTSL